MEVIIAVLTIPGTYLAIPVLGLIWLANHRDLQNQKRLLREAVLLHQMRR